MWTLEVPPIQECLVAHKYNKFINTFLLTIYKTRNGIKNFHLLSVSNSSWITSAIWWDTGIWPTRQCWWSLGMFFSIPHLHHIDRVRPGIRNCREDVNTPSTRHKKSHYYDQDIMRWVAHWYKQADAWRILSTLRESFSTTCIYLTGKIPSANKYSTPILGT
jgi:hypothetical protein